MYWATVQLSMGKLGGDSRASYITSMPHSFESKEGDFSQNHILLLPSRQLSIMPVPIQIDPFSIVINSAALLVAILQLCFMWKERIRREHRLLRSVDGNDIDTEVRGQCSRDACMLNILNQYRRISILATLSRNYLVR
jgi:hypothetical protein